MPQKLEKCVADLKAQGKPDDSAYPICIDSTGEKPHKEASYGSIKAEIAEAIIREHVGDNKFRVKGKPDNKRVNANRQVPVFNPPITNRPVEPDVQKTTKGIGGQVGKIDSKSNTNNMTTDLWKKILDSQLRRNVKEPRY